MDVRVYEVLLHFNQGFTQALASLDIIEKLEMAAPDYVSKVRTNLSELRADANDHFTCKIARKEQEEENHFYRIRRKREKAEEDPNDIYHDVKAREWLRREKGLPPRAVVLPWTQADDDRILAMQKAAASASPPQTEQSRNTGDAKPESPEGGIGT
jgi:hypothetical protein